MPSSFDKYSDIINSRDVVARIKELKELDVCAMCGTEFEMWTEEQPRTCGDCSHTETEDDISKRISEDEREELATLEALADEASGSSDWGHGETLIRDSYFKHYAKELAEDCGMLKDAQTWPGRCIDWDQAARELQMDYMSVEFDDITYWIRS